MDLIFVPSLEPDRLLGLADLYHELGHIILFREERRLVFPGMTAVDRHFDRLMRQGQHAGWAPQSLQEIEQFRHMWRGAWFLEFGADLIATYLVGPAFGWCNIRTSTNIGGELFQGSDTHPADDARSMAIGLMLHKLGERQAAGEIRARWLELVALSSESEPPRYDSRILRTCLRNSLQSSFSRRAVALDCGHGIPPAGRQLQSDRALHDALDRIPDASGHIRQGYERA